MNRKILYELKNLDCEIISRMNKQSMPLGLTQVKIIEYLIKNEHTYQKVLEKNLKLSSDTISCVLQTMEKNKLIERCSNESDARSKEVKLNEKLKTKLEENIKEIGILEQNITKGIDKEDLEIFLKVLNKMKENIRSDKNDKIN